MRRHSLIDWPLLLLFTAIVAVLLLLGVGQRAPAGPLPRCLPLANSTGCVVVER